MAHSDIPASVDSSGQVVAPFIARWQKSGAAERANYQLFLSELCEVLGVPKPEPTQADVSKNAYVFERDVTFYNMDGTTSIGRIDLYKRGCFVLEAKQGSEQTTDDDPFKLNAKPTKTKKGTAVRGTKGWDDAMVKARGQAEQYARALPNDEGLPPFLIVVDVGHSIELFADFTQAGKTYLPFPDPASFRVSFEKLGDAEQREKLRAAWTDPISLDPSRRSAKVTRELADRLARLAKSLEASKYDPGRVAHILMRCLFTMFAEDVDLIPKRSFTELLIRLRGKREKFPDMVRSLWESMDKGTFSPILEQKLRRFNGGLFEDCEALPLSDSQLELLIDASKAEWREVEPAIFGTLLERALDPVERHKLGAHFTPRAYVERLVIPTIVEPLREEWDAVRTAALTHATRGQIDDAQTTVRDFHIKLCETNVLDPACGTGNFLYVALEHMKRLEGEVLTTLRDFGFRQIELRTVNPEHFHGIELNPRAAAIADLVLWIGYLQWHLRTRDLSQLQEPIIAKFKNIECRDAVLTWESERPVVDSLGKPLLKWDRRTFVENNITGNSVPDETAAIPVTEYIHPQSVDWPLADYIVGNPPFIASRNFHEELGDAYADAIDKAYPEIRSAVDFVMYFVHKGASLVASGKVRKCGFITTNKFRSQQNQTVVRDVVSAGSCLEFAIPDHPWPNEEGAAKVRIAMTVFGQQAISTGHKCHVWLSPDHDQVARNRSSLGELRDSDFRVIELDSISPDLSISADIQSLLPLRAWERLCHSGMKPYAKTLLLEPERARELFNSDEEFETHAPQYRNGKDVAGIPREVRVLDFYGIDEPTLRNQFPKAYQYLFDNTRPERAGDRDPRVKREWWLFQRNRPEFREAIHILPQYIATVENSPVRYFVRIDSRILPDQKLRVIASAEPSVFAILSSRAHAVFAARCNSRQGVANTPVYNTRSTTHFPMPILDEGLRAKLGELADQLDAHRKKQQSIHPTLTLTGMYNVLEKLHSGEQLTAKEKIIHEEGLISVLKLIHEEIDAAVFDGYGWPITLTDEDVLERLVALNSQRVAEEERGLIRWLRPEFQNPSDGKLTQTTIEVEDTDEEAMSKPTTAKKSTKKLSLPDKLPGQVLAIRQQLSVASKPLSASEMAKLFNRAKPDQIEELLQSLVILGTARKVDGDKFVAA